MIYALYLLQNDAKMNVLSHIGQSYIGKGETMSQDAVERLLGRLITDEHFRQMSEDSLFMACQQTGFLLSSTGSPKGVVVNFSTLKCQRCSLSVTAHGYRRSLD